LALFALLLCQPLRATPGEASIDPFIALAPTIPIDPSERLVAKKDVLFEQPLAWPVAAKLAGDANTQDSRSFRYRINSAEILQGRPFSANFGQGARGNYAFCGRGEYRRHSWESERWKSDSGGLCLFDSNGDGTLDEWRPRDGNARFTTKTDPFPPVAFTVLKNYRLPYPLQLIYSGNIVSNLARSFTVKLGEYSPIIVPFEKLREEGEWTILGFQGAELAVARREPSVSGFSSRSTTAHRSLSSPAQHSA
jgi:hypothetical protein